MGNSLQATQQSSLNKYLYQFFWENKKKKYPYFVFDKDKVPYLVLLIWLAWY